MSKKRADAEPTPSKWKKGNWTNTPAGSDTWCVWPCTEKRTANYVKTTYVGFLLVYKRPWYKWNQWTDTKSSTTGLRGPSDTITNSYSSKLILGIPTAAAKTTPSLSLQTAVATKFCQRPKCHGHFGWTYTCSGCPDRRRKKPPYERGEVF